jgi:hypothetical protein
LKLIEKTQPRGLVRLSYAKFLAPTSGSFAKASVQFPPSQGILA